MVLMRIIIVWLVVNAGQSLAVAVLFQMMSNSVWGVFKEFGPGMIRRSCAWSCSHP